MRTRTAVTALGLSICVWHMQFQPFICMLIAECRHCTLNVCILIFFNSTGCRAHQLNTKCASAVPLSDADILWHSHSRAVGREPDIITYLHSYAVFLLLFVRFSIWAELMCHFVAYVQSAHSPTLRKLDSFATFRKWHFCHWRLPPYVAQHSKIDKSVLERNGCYLFWMARQREWWRGVRVGLYCSTLYKTSSHLPNGIFSVIIWAFNPLV